MLSFPSPNGIQGPVGVATQITQAKDAADELKNAVSSEYLNKLDQELLAKADQLTKSSEVRHGMQQEIDALNNIKNQEAIVKEDKAYFGLTNEQVSSLKNKHPGLQIETIDGKQVVSKNNLDRYIDKKNVEKANVGLDSEKLSLEVNQLISERKQALSLISAIIKSNNELAMSLINNIK